MNEDIQKVLNKIIDKGYQAYVVGGYVRDYLMGNISYDVDIATNALPNELNNIFDNISDTTLGGITLNIGEYTYDITTFREEKKYEGRKPIEFNYIDDLKKDILRRDFTINSLYMDIDGNIIDLYDGISDIEHKIIKGIGNINDKMIQDPLRMLRAIRFKVLLDFEIEENLLTFIKQNKELINTLSYHRKKEELDFIIKSKNAIKGLKYIKELKLEDVLDIKIPDELRNCDVPIGIWAQLEVSPQYAFTKNEIGNINDIKNILSYGIIDNIILYKYGLYLSRIAGSILGIPLGYISDIYKDLPIYSVKDIEINGDEIIELLNIKPGKIIKEIFEDLELNILDGKIKNNHEELKQYILDNWR